jgi:hypothetical protein
MFQMVLTSGAVIKVAMLLLVLPVVRADKVCVTSE